MSVQCPNVLREWHGLFGDIAVLTNRRTRPVLVPPAVRDCVCFAYAVFKGDQRPIGTAFFLGLPLGETGHFTCAVVTALHILAKARTHSDDGCVHLRVNTPDGYRFVKLEDDVWTIPEQTDRMVDVAVAHWPFSREEYDFRFVSTDQCATEDVIISQSIGPGDEVFLAGLFVNHFGTQRNTPIVRVGNIASMPGKPISVREGSMEAYLVEARSVGGLSGSPVFVMLDLFQTTDKGVVQRPAGTSIWYLLGVMHGHWDARLEDVVVDSGRSTEYVNMGIAIVTPIGAVLEMIDSPSIRKVVEGMTEQVREQTLPVADAAELEVQNEFENFEDLTRKLVNVPKKELDDKRKDES